MLEDNLGMSRIYKLNQEGLLEFYFKITQKKTSLVWAAFE